MDDNDLLEMVKSKQQKFGVQPIIESQYKPKLMVEKKYIDYSKCCLCKSPDDLIRFYNVPICKKCKAKIEHDVEVKHGI